MTSRDRPAGAQGWNPEEFAEVARVLIERLCRYVGDSRAGALPVVGRRAIGEVARELDAARWIEEGGMDAASFAAFVDAYLACSTQLHHPSYLAHQVAAPDVPAGLASLMHGVMNNPMAVYEMGPAAATLELVVVNWMLRMIGWAEQPLGARPGEHGAGVLTHGGSLANLTALLAARARVCPEAWDQGTPPDLALVAPASSHYSVSRAASIMGMGQRAVVRLDEDDRGVVVADSVARVLDRLEADGRRPVAVVANACSTSTGLHDPVDAIADACGERGVWLHVDACHGAAALLSPVLRDRLRGIDRADSVVWDAHKMLRTPTLSAAALFRRAADCDATFRQRASYLFYDDAQPGFDVIGRAVECTKAPLALPIFLNLAWRGQGGLAAYVEGRYALTRRLRQLIAGRDGFEAPFEPESNILCFRYRSSDELQLAIRERLLAAGTYHLSSAEVAGVRYLRLAVMSPDSDETTIEGLLDAIEVAAS